MEFDILSLGPARMDCFVGLPEDDVREVCSIDKEKCVIELGFGDKIPVTSMSFAVGGNTGNNAVGLTRLGHKAAMLGTMGGEWVDQRALQVLKDEGVNVENITTQEGKFGFGVIINYQGERTILSYYPDSDCDFTVKSADLTTKWVYLTTAGHNYECFYEDAVAWVKEKGAKLAFNPGSRQIRDGMEKLKYVIEASEVMFVNREEAAKLLGRDGGTEVAELLTGLLGAGTKIAVITDGPVGAYAHDGTSGWFMPPVPATVVERTGAGDAFGSGFLAAIMGGKSLPEALKWGACNSASVLEHIGPQAGLLTREGMEKRLAENGEINVKEI